MADSGSARRWELGAPDAAHRATIARLRRDLHRRLAAVGRTIFIWLERSRQRRQLAALSDGSLKDLDISRADAEGEYRKYFWQQ